MPEPPAQLPQFRGYPVIERNIRVAHERYRILGPANFEELIDDPRVEARFAVDEFMPYWAEFWPAARLLAEEVATWPQADAANPATVFEFGCGLGLIGLVAQRLGYRTTLSDYDDDALAFVLESAKLNDLPAPNVAFVDWREDYPHLRSDRILAAEVLYEKRNLVPIAQFLAKHLNPGGFALLIDGNRQTADPFPKVAAEENLKVTVEPRSQSFDGTEVNGRLFRVEHR